MTACGILRPGFGPPIARRFHSIAALGVGAMIGCAARIGQCYECGFNELL